MQVETPSLSALLFSAKFDVEKHVVKKNRKAIHYRWGSGNSFTAKGKRFTPFIGSTPEQKNAELFLVRTLQDRARYIRLDKPLDSVLWIVLRAYFPESDFYTKKGEMKLTLPDQLNVFQIYEDALQKAGVIKNDSLLRAHDFSTCLPSNRYHVEILLFDYEESPAWKLKTFWPRP